MSISIQAAQWRRTYAQRNLNFSPFFPVIIIFTRKDTESERERRDMFACPDPR